VERRQFGGLAQAFAARLPRRSVLGGLAGGGLALGAAGLAPVSAAAQSTTEVGVAPVGQIGLELLGHLEQNGTDFTTFGYLTHIGGLEPATLFINDVPIARTEGDAHFTFWGSAKLTGRSVLGPLIVVDADGEMTFFYHEQGGATYDKGASFKIGTAVAAMSLHIQTILNQQDKKNGHITGTGNLAQTEATSFAIGDTTYQFGHVGLTGLLYTTGQAMKLDPPTPKRSESQGGGYVLITGPASR
jgi:hypothetical protein